MGLEAGTAPIGWYSGFGEEQGSSTVRNLLVLTTSFLLVCLGLSDLYIYYFFLTPFMSIFTGFLQSLHSPPVLRIGCRSIVKEGK